MVIKLYIDIEVFSGVYPNTGLVYSGDITH